MLEKVILIGAGGHARSCIDVIESTNRYEIAGLLGRPEDVGKHVLTYKVIGTDDDLKMLVEKGYSFVVAIGQIKSAKARIKIFEKLKAYNAKVPTVISPLAKVSKHASIGIGTMVMHFVVVNAEVQIGDSCILNTGSIIEHNSFIGNHTHISTHAIVNGDCRVGSECFIGSNATISSQVSVGDKLVVGAGSTVIRDIFEAGIYVGSPVQKKQ